MRRVTLAAVILLLSSCGQVSTAPPAKPSSAVRTQTAPVVTTTPTVTTTPPQAKVPCKLPIGVGRALSGFMTYPGGTFTPDPSSDPAQAPYHAPNSSSLGGLGVPTYDWPASRWLPVPKALVSSDGATYAYEELVFPPVGPTPVQGMGSGPIGSRIHLVTVASAADRVILDSQSLWSVVAYSGQQIYLIRPCLEGCGADAGGLWTLNPSSGALQQIATPDAPVPFNPSAGVSQHLWTVVGSGAAWATDPQGGLARFDLATRTVSIWLTVPGKELRPIGLDAEGLPIAEGEANYKVAGSTRGGAWFVKAPRQAIQIAPDSVMIDGAVADGHGIWLTSFQDIYLWGYEGHAVQVGTLPGQGDRGLSGPCL